MPSITPYLGIYILLFGGRHFSHCKYTTPFSKFQIFFTKIYSTTIKQAFIVTITPTTLDKYPNLPSSTPILSIIS